MKDARGGAAQLPGSRVLGRGNHEVDKMEGLEKTECLCCRSNRQEAGMAAAE